MRRMFVDRGRHGIRLLYWATCEENRLVYTSSHICPKGSSIQMKSPSCRLFHVLISPFCSFFSFPPCSLCSNLKCAMSGFPSSECRVPCVKRGKKKKKEEIKHQRRQRNGSELANITQNVEAEIRGRRVRW